MRNNWRSKIFLISLMLNLTFGIETLLNMHGNTLFYKDVTVIKLGELKNTGETLTYDDGFGAWYSIWRRDDSYEVAGEKLFIQSILEIGASEFNEHFALRLELKDGEQVIAYYPRIVKGAVNFQVFHLDKLTPDQLQIINSLKWRSIDSDWAAGIFLLYWLVFPLFVYKLLKKPTSTP